MQFQRLKSVCSARLQAGAADSSKCPPEGGRYKTLYRALQRASVVALLVIALAATASARQLRIQKFSAEIFVQPDATLDVTETIHVNFIGEWHGLYRTIPVEYVTPQGFNYSLFVKFDGATDAADQPLKVESSREGHYLKWKIYVNDATDAERTIRLHYQVRNGLKFFEDHDELYWNVTGDEWDVPVGDASAEIFLPQGVTGLRTNEFTGSYRSRGQDAEVTASDYTVEVSMTSRPLFGFHEGLTMVVGWDKGFVTEPGKSELVSQFLASNWPIFFPVPVFLFMFWLWYSRGRDPRMGPVAVQYAPPEGMSPGGKPARWWMSPRLCGTLPRQSSISPCADSSSSKKRISRESWVCFTTRNTSST